MLQGVQFVRLQQLQQQRDGWRRRAEQLQDKCAELQSELGTMTHLVLSSRKSTGRIQDVSGGCLSPETALIASVLV
jgi:hypothetical protein